MSNPYAPPMAQLEQEMLDTDGQGSLQAGINGDYDFSVGEILGEAWEKVRGAKGTILLACLVYLVATIVVGFVRGLLFPDPGHLLQQHQWGAGVFWIAVFTLIDLPLIYPLLAGIILLGIRRSINAEISIGLIFRGYAKTLPLALAVVISMTITLLGYALLVLPGIYLSIAYIMVIPLLMNRDIGVWDALEASRKAISKRWFKIFFFYLLLAVIFVVACLPLLIGLIWAIPLIMIANGLLYKRIFGVEHQN